VTFHSWLGGRGFCLFSGLTGNDAGRSQHYSKDSHGYFLQGFVLVFSSLTPNREFATIGGLFALVSEYMSQI